MVGAPLLAILALVGLYVFRPPDNALPARVTLMAAQSETPSPTMTATGSPTLALAASATPLRAGQPTAPVAPGDGSPVPESLPPPTASLAATLTPTVAPTAGPSPTLDLTASPTPTPTDTPSPAASPTATGEASPTNGPTASATSSAATPTPSATPTATTPPPVVVGNARLYVDALKITHLVGEIINTTAQDQQVAAVTGQFFDAQGARLPAVITAAYYPQTVIPANGRAPVELTLSNAAAVNRWSLMVDSLPALTPIRYDLVISNELATADVDSVCLSGTIRNGGAPLAGPLVMAVVLYDANGAVVNFKDYAQDVPNGQTGAAGLNFEICVPPPLDGVATWQTYAWSR